MSERECNCRTVEMSGKLAPEALIRSVFGSVGAKREEVLIGPGVGEDAAVIEWPRGKLMVFASDPIVGATAGAGRLLVRVNVNDIASKGGEPAYLTTTLILPPAMGEEAIARIMGEIHEECLACGIAVVGGHSEFNDMYAHPVLCASLVGTAERVFRASAVKKGDLIFVSKHIGIEGMAILASDRADLLSAVLSPSELDKVRGWMDDTSVLAESRILRDYASFMHDPTEGGFYGGVEEICRLAGLEAEIEPELVPVHPYTRRAALALGFDPLRLVASGSMLATVPPESADKVARAFADAGLPIACVGRMGGPRTASDGREAPPREELWGLLRRG